MDSGVSPAFNFPSRHMSHVTFFVTDIQSRWMLTWGSLPPGLLPGQLQGRIHAERTTAHIKDTARPLASQMSKCLDATCKVRFAQQLFSVSSISSTI